MNRKIFCITGMHRSGTSLLANWMQEIGVVLDFGNLIPATYWNKKGHYEDEGFVDFHQKALLDRFPNSHGWRITTPYFFSFTAQQKRLAKSFLKIREKFNCWGWKDPRSVFFAQAWLQLSTHIHVIVIYRSARSVITSLINRSNLAFQLSPNQSKLLYTSVDQAIEMWKAHNLLALELKDSYDERVTLFSIDSLINFDRSIFNHLNILANQVLKYIPVDKVYDSDLICSDIDIFDNTMNNKIAHETRHLELLLLNRSNFHSA